MSAKALSRQDPIGVVGLGVMGTAFASNLLGKGYPVHVFNRTAGKAEALARKGAVPQSTPRELAQHVDVILTSLTDDRAIEGLAYGGDGFLAPGARAKLWIDLSTIDPEASVREAAAAARLGVTRLDAPVVGSREPAERGEVTVLAGGDVAAFHACESLLHDLGASVVYLGAAGNGAKMKLVINQYLGLIAEALSEALVLARKMGFDAAAFFDTLNSTAHRNSYSVLKGRKIVEGSFTTADFSLNNLLKDLRLASTEADRTGADLPIARIVLQRASQAAARGDGPDDFSVLALELQRQNGLAP